jgi:type I restriction enzyme S subunit
MTSSTPKEISRASWLKELPEDWKISRFKYVFEFVKNDKPPSLDTPLLSLTRKGIVERDTSDNSGQLAADFSSYPVISPGTFTLNPMDLVGGWVAISKLQGQISPAYFSFDLKNARYSSSYFEYLLQSYFQQKTLDPFGVGVGRGDSGGGRWTLNRETLRIFPVPVPPIPQQHAIAEILDRETGQIDNLIAEQEKLITTLGERRDSLVLRCVTMGLDENVETKPTGIYWTPECPQHWVVERLSRHFVALKGSNAAQLNREFCATIPGDFPVYSGQTSNEGVMAEIDTWEFDRGATGTILTTTVGSGQVMKMRRIFGKFSLSQNCMLIDTKTGQDPDFFRYQFEANFEATRGEQSSHMQTSFRMSDLYAKKILIPPRDEQAEIARFLDSQLSQLEKLSRASLSMIALLNERRNALISAAVTGKIDVRG